ncbi:MAG: hypothetical protein HC844_10755 [Tabrizicola sp.]|nr:hypothetical protein [Tabrizicola sp.]
MLGTLLISGQFNPFNVTGNSDAVKAQINNGFTQLNDAFDHQLRRGLRHRLRQIEQSLPLEIERALDAHLAQHLLDPAPV